MSIVIPCHNYGRFLGEAMESLDRQTRAPDEIIMCDDGSTDDSWEVMQALAADRDEVTAYRHGSARGLVRTLNELVAKTSGDVIITLSADDRMDAGYIEAIESAMRVNGWDFAYSDYKCFGAETGYVRVPDLDIDLLARRNYINGAAGIRRELFDTIGGFRTSFDRLGFEDYDWWLSVVESGASGGRAPGAVVEWRRHAGGSRNTATRTDRVRLRLKLLRWHPRFFLHPRTLRAFGDWARHVVHRA